MSAATGQATTVDVTMPQMGVSVAEGTVLVWSKRVGEAIERDETICEISTDKIDSEVPAPASGVVAEILVEEGTTVDVGVVLARIAVGGDGDGAVIASDGQGAVIASGGEGAVIASVSDGHRRPSEPAAISADGASRASAVRSSPVARRIAQEHGIDLAAIAGSGREGRVTKQDVLRAVADGASRREPVAARPEPILHSDSPYRPDDALPVASQPPAAVSSAPPPGALAARSQDGAVGESAPLSAIRRSIARHMLHSLQTAAHCTTIVEVDVSGVEARRRELQLTALPLIARCVLDVLPAYRDLNAWLDGDTITRHSAIHLGIAVSLGDGGLIVPVIHDAQELTAEGLARRIKELAAKARAGKLEHAEISGATFTITNPGAFGAIAATPIISQPQVAILDTEAIVRRPVVVDTPDGGEAIAVRPMMNLCMSWDHRALDGAYAARFLSDVRRRVESLADGG